MRQFLLYGLCLLFFTSCDRETIVTQTNESDVFRIASVNLGNTATRNIITGIGSGTPSGDASKISSLGIYAACTDGSEYKPVNGRNTATYVYQNNKWLTNPDLTGDESLRLSQQQVYIYGWHPSALLPKYENGNPYITGIEIVEKDDFKATAQTDYLYATGYVSGDARTAVTSQNNPGLKFNMDHALAKLTFKMKKDVSIAVDEALTLKQLTIKSPENKFLTGSGSNRRMNLTDGILSGLIATEKLIYTGELTLDHSGADVIALVAPIKDMQRFGFELSVELASGETRQYQTKTLNVSTTWLAGKNYVYKIKVDKMSATLDGPVEVYDWTDEKNEIPIQ